MFLTSKVGRRMFLTSKVGRRMFLLSRRKPSRLPSLMPAAATSPRCSTPRRFNELKRLVDGISQRMLTLSLRGLERDGLVTRKVTPSIPPRVDYALSELGQSLREPVSALGEWAIAHIACIRAAQAAFDARSDA
jgi:DNA-binding HxlR family transcriptional regulator